MAKWGEGDPRWIVEERPDATNVNNWHWTEKNACSWSKDYLRDLLVGLNLKNSAGSCKITSIEKCEGDASANNRKAKIIVFYEWELSLKWVGKVKDKEVKGFISIPNLSDENTAADLDIQIRTEDKSDEAQTMKDALRSEGTEIIRQTLNKYIIALKDEYTKGMILPKKDTSVSSTMSKLSLSHDEGQVAAVSTGPAKVNGISNTGVKLDLCDINTEASMKCTANDVYNALTRPEMFVAFTNGSGQIEPKVGGKFHMFGGNVHGKILELDPPKKIVQDWRFKHWPEGHYSRVTFTIDEKQDTTKVKVNQQGVPASDQEKTREGWDLFYWDAMKRTFGFGSYIL
ncbi:unnamed protein product [Allacma fusca]|uniref:Activator of Hsp90 ATPase AHSA1-like N-terminal domain-containing protein n=1 Tax=Allacma fusca TaxID=39272 RepID=A0A8J2JHM9_9HEXA|nr:unnamed protein product [Allacma fusca]